MDSEGSTDIVVYVDRVIKMDYLAAVPDTIDDKGTAKLFIDRVFCHHGLPVAIISYIDPRFIKMFWNSFFKVLGTRLDMSTADRLQTDGQTERLYRDIGDILRSIFAITTKLWKSILTVVEFALNNAVHNLPATHRST